MEEIEKTKLLELSNAEFHEENYTEQNLNKKKKVKLIPTRKGKRKHKLIIITLCQAIHLLNSQTILYNT